MNCTDKQKHDADEIDLEQGKPSKTQVTISA